MDQSFSTENFRRIWDLRTRRGDDLTRFFADLVVATDKLREATGKLREAVNKFSDEGYSVAGTLESLHQKKYSASEHKEQVLQHHLSRLSLEANARIDDGNFQIPYQPSLNVRGKQTYKLTSSDATAYFISKQVEQNLKSAFSIRPQNRNLASEQLLLALDDLTSKIVVRTDIRACFESIPHDGLRKLLGKSTGLSRTTIRYIDTLLTKHAMLVGSEAGLPRGLGISSALAEAYLSQLDAEFGKLPGLLFYVRYVDDIVMVFGGSSHHPSVEERKKQIRKVVLSLGLSMNPSKTRYISTMALEDRKARVNYLGYEFEIGHKSVTVDISKNRQARYKERLDLAFANYDPGDGSSSRMLIDRIRFLTGNTRLSNNKRQALIGIYYSNSLLRVSTARIRSLDRHLKEQLENSPVPDGIARMLANLSFCSGFEKREFNVFRHRRLSDIVRIWKHND